MFKIRIALPLALASLILGTLSLPTPVKAQSGDYIDCSGLYHTDGNSYDLSYDSQGAYYLVGNTQKRPRKNVSNLRGPGGSCESTSQTSNRRTTSQPSNRQNRSQAEKVRQDRQQSEKARRDRQNQQNRQNSGKQLTY